MHFALLIEIDETNLSYIGFFVVVTVGFENSYTPYLKFLSESLLG